MRLGARLRIAREKRDLTQEELATAASTKSTPVSQASISALEARDSETTTYLFSLARALKVNPEWLQTGEGESGLDADEWRPLPAVSTEERDLLRDYRDATDTWKLTIRLVAKAKSEEHQQLSRDMNKLIGVIFGQAASDSRVVDSLRSSRHGFPPGVHEQGAKYDKSKDKKD